MSWTERGANFVAGAAIAAKARVMVMVDTTGGIVSPLQVVYADADHAGLGVSTIPADPSPTAPYGTGPVVSVKLWNDSGTFEVEAAGPIPDGAPVYAAANGQVAASGSVLVGTAKKGASGAGSIAEIIPVAT